MGDLPKRIHRVTRSGEGDRATGDPAKHVSGAGDAVTWNAFTNAAGRFHVGHWSADPGIRTVHYTEDEFCVILEGRVRIDGTDGTAEFGPGDAFVIEAGFLGTWEVIEAVTKLYAIFEPEPVAIL